MMWISAHRGGREVVIKSFSATMELRQKVGPYYQLRPGQYSSGSRRVVADLSASVMIHTRARSGNV